MEFDIPRETSSIIKVIGVGGGGSNAVNHMYNQGIVGVDFIVCNTDRQALDISPVPHKVQLGPALTEGRGAGMLPEVGMQAAIENIEEIRELLSKNTKMVFVTVPFNFEGRKRRQQAEEGLEKMRQNVDTLLIINNERLREFGKNMSLTDAFSHADNILTVAAKGIAEVISVTGIINVDFNDVNTVLRNSGQAIMGSAIAEGDDRALVAVKNALTSPLLNDNDINGARYVLLNITYGNMEVMMDEITEITDYIQDAAGATADVIWGHGFDASLGDNLSITLIATGFSSTPITGFEKAPERKIVSLEEDNKKEITAPLVSPLEQAVIQPTVQEQLTQEPFLKSEETIESVLPVGTINPIIEEKKSFDLFESTNVENTVSSEYLDTAISDISNDIENNGNVDEPITFANSVDTEIENTSNLYDEEQASEVKPEFSWEVIDSTVENENDVKDEVRHFTLFDNPVNIDHSKKALSNEEQQRKVQERVSKIQEYTAKLKKAEGIAEFENEPAFVRRNINLNQSNPSTDESFSRFGLTSDNEGNTGLRNNNFLHDNVD